MRIFGALDAFAGSSRPGVRNRGAGGRAPSDLSGEASSPLSRLPAASGSPRPGRRHRHPCSVCVWPPSLRGCAFARFPACACASVRPSVCVCVFFLQGHGSHRFKGRSTSVRLPLN